MPESGPYTIAYKGYVLTVYEHDIEGSRVFHIEFSNHLKPLNLVVVESTKGAKFWTSIPPGRQAEADEFGPLIGWYYHQKKIKK
jgi:hypothetical protein